MSDSSLEPNSDHWELVVVRASGLNHMRSERPWRPIVTVDVNEHSQHEAALGIDGQNVNQKSSFKFHSTDLSSKVDLKVWHQPQSKKKGKKKILIASSCVCIKDLWKKQLSNGKKVEVSLNSQQLKTKRLTATARGQPKGGALLILRLRPPHYMTTQADHSSSINSGYHSDTLVVPSSPASHSSRFSELPEQSKRRIRRRKGYKIFSDDESTYHTSTDDEYSEEFDDSVPPNTLDFPTKSMADDKEISSFEWDSLPAEWLTQHELVHIERPQAGREGTGVGWIASSLLPAHTLSNTQPSCGNKDFTFSFTERLISAFTIYEQLQACRVDSDYEHAFTKIKSEWAYCCAFLSGLSAIDAAAFAITPDAAFSFYPITRMLIAVSAMTSGVGIFDSTWKMFWYSLSDVQQFRLRACDLQSQEEESYFFFAISSRIPAICMLISALTLMCSLTTVAFNAWPLGITVIFFLLGIMVSLQFLVFGAQWFTRRVIMTIRAVTKGVFKIFRLQQKSSEAPPSTENENFPEKSAD